MKKLNLSYENNTIVIKNQGTYKGCDGEMYPYATTYTEGTGIKDLWDYIVSLEEQVFKQEMIV